MHQILFFDMIMTLIVTFSMQQLKISLMILLQMLNII